MKKYLFVAYVLLFSLLIAPGQANQPKTQVLTVKNELNISINSQRLSDTALLVAPYKTMDIFISEEQAPGFKFTSVGGLWNEIKPNGTNVEGQVRFKIDEVWGEWIDLEEEQDLIQSDAETNFIRKYAMASTNPADAMQFKFLLYGDGVNVPLVKNPEWTFINTEETAHVSAEPTPQYSANTTDPTYLALTSVSTNVVTRSQWGADEDYRYLESNDIDPVLVETDPGFYEKYKEELKYSKVVTKDSSGNKYKWPLQYPEKVSKFIIHHTATNGNLDNPEQAIRDIYHYHAITRQWGDIGYNYVVDQDGKIYEGRYGGEGVIGAHSGPGNTGSVGIAILGNYENTPVPENIIASVSNFIGKKAKIHGIDSAGKSYFRGQEMPNIFGHKDIMSTTCPGVYLYEKLPAIRVLAAAYKPDEKKKFTKEYDYQDKSEVYYLELKPEETLDVTLKLENIGTVDWNSDTFIVVDSNPEFSNFITFPESDEVVLAKVQESLVKPGETATFKFKIKAGKKSDLVYMNIAPLMNGKKKAKDYVVIPIFVEQVAFKYQFIDSKYPPKAMEKGESFSGWVKLKNTGNTTWRKSGSNTVVLGTDHERDRISKVFKATRIGFLQEETVAPGETGTFLINFKAPQTSGYYKEYFTPVIEGESWMSDSGMYFETTVYGGKYEAELLDTSAVKNWERNGKYMVKIKLRNIGQESWSKENLKLTFVKSKKITITDPQLIDKTVAPGEVGTIVFVAKVSDKEKLGKKSVMVYPKVDGKKLLKKVVRVKYTVIEEKKPTVYSAPTEEPETVVTPSPGNVTESSGKESTMRVKLSYSGNPQITASGSFEVYSGASLLATLSAGELAEVKRVNSSYQVTTPSNTFTKTDVIRFKPKNTAILEIDNYNHQPAWNPSLNDNQYRGILEVREVDGTLRVINELPLEDYLKGLGEVSNTEEMEKIKAIIIAARSYAKYYIDIDQKFPGKPYNLEDDPNTSQKYLGYGLELRSPNVNSAVDATRGQIVTYNGTLIKTPYFNQSDGKATKSAKSVWNWDAPYLVSVSDSYCDGKEFLGHGVGLSGCGAKGMAKAGFDYVAILKHYYTGIEVTDLY